MAGNDRSDKRRKKESDEWNTQFFYVNVDLNV